MKKGDFERSCERYEEEFVAMTEHYQIPASWLEYKDHLAIKCADPGDFYDAIDLFRPLVLPETLGEIVQANRRLASGTLIEPIRLAGHDFETIEIMEPRSGMETKESFVEHTEFTVNDLLTILNGLVGPSGRITEGDEDVKVHDQRKSHHPGIVLEFSDGLEVKFNETSLADMVKQEQAQGIWRRIR